MIKRIICFTDRGKAVADKLNRRYEEEGIEPAEIFRCSSDRNPDGTAGSVTLDRFTKEGFKERHALIFIGAVGIAVRAISPYVEDKLSDSPVIVIDDNGEFVIPILSGHAGGANKVAQTIAALIDAIPVVTTSTDINSAFSPDVFATENRLTIRNRDGIRKVSSKAIEGKPITISVKDYPPRETVDIIIADETDREYDLLLSPKSYIVGIGLKKGKDAAELEQFVLDVLKDLRIGIDDILAVATIDIKEDEPALRSLCDKHRLPLITFEASILAKARGDFSASSFVKDTVGVDNVCERAAILAAGPRGEIVVNKVIRQGITLAVAKR